MDVWSVRWADGAVEIIDQTLLPHRVEVRRLADDDSVAEAIASLRVRGAPAIGLTAAFAIAAAAQRAAAAGASREETVAAARRCAERLRPVRPTAVNLAWACDRMTAAVEGAGPDAVAVAERALAEARAIEAEDRAACAAMGRAGAEWLRRRCGDRPLAVLTHCNTGALCTAGIGTAFGVVRTLHEQGRLRHLWVDETRPLLQGARLTAWEAAQLGIPHAVVVDAAAGALMASGQVDAVVVGADRVAANGDVANKIGTYTLAVLAHRHGIPFVVVAPRSSVDARTPTGAAIPVEERPAREVTHCGDTPTAPAESAAANPAFDITPAELVTALVTEDGVSEPR